MRAEAAVAAIVATAEARLAGAGRRPFILGIAGPPAVGKSTVAEGVARTLRAVAGRVVLALPMDGFHLSDEELRKRGTHAWKGREDTFDAEGFARLLARIRGGEAGFHWPTFDRKRERVVPRGILVDAVPEVAVLEGNYLLLDWGPWAGIRPMLDLVVFLDAPEAVLRERLLRRHMAGGRTPEAAHLKAEETDLPNMRLIRATAARADLTIGGED